MVKFIKKKIKVQRRLGILPKLTNKSPKNRLLTPGVHGKISQVYFAPFARRAYLTESSLMNLLNWQKMRYNYALAAHKIKRYLLKAKSLRTASKYSAFSNLLELRLDTYIRNCGYAKSMLEARQLITHGHIRVNSIYVNKPNIKYNYGDFICHAPNITAMSKLKKNMLWFLKIKLKRISYRIMKYNANRNASLKYEILLKAKHNSYVDHSALKIAPTALASQIIASPIQNKRINLAHSQVFKY